MRFTRLKRLAAVSALSALAVTGFVTTPASAAPSCTAGYTCLYTKTDGAGLKYSYSQQSSYTHDVAAVYYNYNQLPVSFWTLAAGQGVRITGYLTSERGFRNWSSSNWTRSHSFRDYY